MYRNNGFPKCHKTPKEEERNKRHRNWT